MTWAHSNGSIEPTRRSCNALRNTKAKIAEHMAADGVIALVEDGPLTLGEIDGILLVRNGPGVASKSD
jgi:hypothetical protein